jgi:hypothetical protein
LMQSKDPPIKILELTNDPMGSSTWKSIDGSV